MLVTVTLCVVHWSEFIFQVVSETGYVSIIRRCRAEVYSELGPLETYSLDHRVSKLPIFPPLHLTAEPVSRKPSLQLYSYLLQLTTRQEGLGFMVITLPVL